jgi:hypothetical protein
MFSVGYAAERGGPLQGGPGPICREAITIIAMIEQTITLEIWPLASTDR